MIDLHTHTTESDGTLAPEQLVRAALEMGLEALGITDHDTLDGYDRARAFASEAGLDLVCGIELTAALRGASEERASDIHVLGYFLGGEPPESFRKWLKGTQQARRERNCEIAERLQRLGLNVELHEAENLGRNQTGRPHFARVMIEKGYVESFEHAFGKYLAEGGLAYVPKKVPSVRECIRVINESGGISSLAHPIRIGRPETREALVDRICAGGVKAIEAYHSDHSPADVERYRALAEHSGLGITGGSDFHGDHKPGLALGTGYGNVAVPRSVLDNLRACASRG